MSSSRFGGIGWRFSLALVGVAWLAQPAVAFDGWHVLEATTIEGKGSAWDYLSLDAARHRLYIGHRREGLQVFDLDARKVIGTIRGTADASSNGATVIPATQSLFRSGASDTDGAADWSLGATPSPRGVQNTGLTVPWLPAFTPIASTPSGTVNLVNGVWSAPIILPSARMQGLFLASRRVSRSPPTSTSRWPVPMC